MYASASREKPSFDHSVTPPCQAACPLHTDIREYVDLIAQGSMMEALQVIRADNPFPSICAHVCAHPCEERCRRGQVDKPIAIRALKRFALEFGGDRVIQPAAETTRSEKVAVVGSGPAGLACAYYLRRLGYPATVFEAHSEVGGMLRVGIPRYRLPREVLDTEVRRLRQMGVEFRTSTRVASLDLLFSLGYQAVFVTVGAHQGLRLGIEGEESPGVIDGATFLRELNLGLKPTLGDRVAVVGGGNVAIDAARSSVRLGAAQVSILYRRTRAEMPADPVEVEQALEEGVEILFLVNPVAIRRGQGRLAITCIRMELGEPDASGRRRPVPIEGSEFEKEFDTLVTAIGQAPQVPAGFGVRTGRGSTIEVDPATLTTNRSGVFAGGDAVTGPATVVEALAAGRSAAFRIDDYLHRRYPRVSGNDDKGWVGDLLPETIETVRKITRIDPPVLAAGPRREDFVPVELIYDVESATREARRCLRCGVGAEILSQDKCASCLTCLRVCPYKVPRLDGDGQMVIPFEQCQACGVCVAECPAKAIVLRKPCDRRHVDEELDAILADVSASRHLVVGFCCRYGLFGQGNLAGLWRGLKEGVRIVPVLCVAKVEPHHVLRCFEMGAEGVFIAGCGEQCARDNVAEWVSRRTAKVRAVLSQVGLQPDRLQAFMGDAEEATAVLDAFMERVGALYLDKLMDQEVTSC